MPTDRAQDTEAIRAALELAMFANHLDYSPIDIEQAAGQAWPALGRLVARLEAAERERDEAHKGYLREIDAIAGRYERRDERDREALRLLREFYELQQSPRSAVHADGPLVDKIDAALAAAAPGETTLAEPDERPGGAAVTRSLDADTQSRLLSPASGSPSAAPGETQLLVGKHPKRPGDATVDLAEAVDAAPGETEQTP